MEVMPEESLPGDSSSNGLAEESVKSLKAKVRTLTFAAERLHGGTVGDSHNALPWMCEHAASVINRARKDLDGHTAWWNLKGRSWRQPLIPFGEKVLYLPTGKLDRRVGARFLDDGIYYGLHEGTLGHWIGTVHGVVEARAVRRLPPEARRDLALFMLVKGCPGEGLRGSMCLQNTKSCL